MPQPDNPFGSDPSGYFGATEAVVGYDYIAMCEPDDCPVGELAVRAVELQILILQRYDIEPNRAIQALLGKLLGNLPAALELGNESK